MRVSTKGADRAGLDHIELVLADNSAYPPGQFTTSGGRWSQDWNPLVEAEFPNSKGVLLPGMFGRVRLAAETRPDAVLVSERALFDVQGSKAVYIVDARQQGRPPQRRGRREV